MTLIQIILLAIIQGLAELLPVSSTAHVIVAEKLMGIDPSSTQATLMLVMLHTGTMFAVVVYFWKAWRRAFFQSRPRFNDFAVKVIAATAVTGIVAVALMKGIEHAIQHRNPDIPKAQVEDLFKHLELLAIALAAAGVLILWSGFASRRQRGRENVSLTDSLSIGAIQGLCIPFRGFSRSGATISLGLLRGMSKARVEEFSFALAVVLTPAAIYWEGRRLIADRDAADAAATLHAFSAGALGMVFSFLAGLVALRLLSRLLVGGQWWVFGLYCLFAAGAVYALYLRGY